MESNFQKEIDQTGGTLTIQAKPYAESMAKLDQAVKKISEGNDIDHRVLNFESPSLFRKLLTPKRLEMIEWLMERGPSDSIRALARELDRGKGEVHDDLAILNRYGIVHFRQEGLAKQPYIPFDEIDIDIKIKAVA